MPRKPHLALCLIVLASAAPASAQLPELKTPGERELLAQLDADTLATATEVVAQLETWKGKLDAVRKALAGYQQKLKAAETEVAALRDKVGEQQAAAMRALDTLTAAKTLDPKAARELLEAVLPLAKKSDRLKEFTAFAASVEAKLKEVEAKVRQEVEAELKKARAAAEALKADAEALKARGEQFKADVEAVAALDEGQLRAMVEQALRAKLEEGLLEAVGADALRQLDLLKNPVKFARGFLDGEFKKWVGNNALEVTKDLKVRVLTPNPKASLFAEKTDLEIEIEYSAGIKVQATGFGFKYKNASPYFEPFFDEKNAKVTANGRSLLSTAVKQLQKVGIGSLLPKTLPFTVEPKDDLTKIVPGQPLRFDVAIDLGKFGLAGKMAGVVKVSTNKPPEIDGAFAFATKLATPLPLPGMPAVAIHKFGGSVDLTGPVKKLAATVTFAGTSPGADKTLAIEATVSVNIPFDAVTVKGRLLVAGQSMCDAELTLGKLKDGRTGVDITLIVPGAGSAIPKALIDGKARVTITGDELTANGHLTLYSVFKSNFDLLLRRNGSGRFTGKWDGNVLGVSADAAITAEFDAGFKNLVLTSNFNVEINLSGKFGDLLKADLVSASLRVKDSVVTVKASGFGIPLPEFDMDLNGNLAERLREEFEKRVAAVADAIADALAKCDPTNPNSPAAQIGRDLDPFNKNGAAGRFVKELGNVQKHLKNLKFDPAKVGASVGAAADKVSEWSQGKVQGLQKDWKKLEGGGWKDPSNWPGIGGLLGSRIGSGNDTRNGPGNDTGDALVQLLVALYQGGAPLDDAEFVTQLGGAVVSLQDIDFRQSLPTAVTRTPKGRTARGSSAHVRVLAPSLVTVDKDNFLIGFSVKVTGSSFAVEPDKAPVRKSGSQLVGANIKLTRQPDGKWKGKIEQPRIAWEKVCDQDLSLDLSQRLEHRLERIPGVEIDGLRMFYEKALVVRNDAKTDLTVHVQLRTNAPAGGSPDKWEWQWLPAAPPARKGYQFRLKAGETKTVTGRMVGRPTDDPVSAARVRIWADADDGEEWNEHEAKDHWLVPENPKKNGDRAYQAEKLAAAPPYTFRPKAGFRTYSQRVVGFKNATGSVVRVQLHYRLTEDGKTAWKTLPPFDVKPGETLRPREADGQFVRASAIRFVAVSEQFAYRAHLDSPLWLVDDAGGGVRLYKAEKVGSYTHTFDPAPAVQPGGGK